MKTRIEPKDAKYFIEQLDEIRKTAREEVANLWGMKDLFVRDFVSLLKDGLSYKKHPGVSNALARFFTFADEGKNNFFAMVIEIACKRVVQEGGNALVYQGHLATMIEHSSFFKQGMTGPKEAVRRLKPLGIVA